MAGNRNDKCINPVNPVYPVKKIDRNRSDECIYLCMSCKSLAKLWKCNSFDFSVQFHGVQIGHAGDVIQHRHDSCVWIFSCGRELDRDQCNEFFVVVFAFAGS